MPEKLGNILLHLSLVVAFYSVVMSVVGGATGKFHLVKSARNAVWVLASLVALMSGLLVYSLITGRYSIKYVYQYSNSTTPIFYKVAALWGGQEGSLLFWLLILMTYSSLVMWINRRRNAEFLPYIITTLMTIAGFFVILLLFEANPFALLPFTPNDGRGLNPLLQNYYMVIHPPSLYLGYVGMSVPFAYAIAALVTGRLDNYWILQIRRWVLTAWFFLSMGNLLGASWAYEVLGWGGYWGWDPVENAAFMPWLSATAFLHSVIIQEKRGILKTWNMVLVVMSFLFTMTGTFLTRSGIISSVHSFAQSDIGGYFLGILIFTAAISTGLILFRIPELKSKNTLDAVLSRESAFLFNNLVFVGGAFAVLWGTLFPVLSEWVRGTKITVGPPYFNSVMIPIGLLLLLLTGVGPMVAWRKTTPEQLKRNFLFPVAATVLTSIVVFAFASHKVYVVLTFSLCAFVLATIVLEYKRGIAVRKRTLGEDGMTAFLRLIANNKRRYGGYIVHVGIVLLFVGFAGNAFKKELDTQVKVGETISVGDYTATYRSLTIKEDSHKEQVFANFDVFKNGKPYAVVNPSRVFFKSQVEGEPAQPNTSISNKRSLKEDLYTALLSFDPSTQSAFVKFVVNPLVQFVWIGGLFIIFGTVIVMSPASKKAALKTVAQAAMVAFTFLAAAGGAMLLPSSALAAPTVDEISKKLKCQCGCNFPDLASCSCAEWAEPAKAEIRARLSRGEDEETILKYFVGRNGETVLTVPIQTGFNRTTWVVPVAGFMGGLLCVGLIVHFWSKRARQSAAKGAQAPSISESDPYVKKLDDELYG